MSQGEFIKNLIIDIVIAVALAFVVLIFIRPTIVRQTSMLDTLQENDYIIMYQRAYKHSEPQRGDIVIFQSELTNEENGSKKLLIKRVIGLPGDEIRISDGQLYINGEEYYEDYIREGVTPSHEIPEEGETYVVPDDHYYVMGDNRTVSIDSRYAEVGCITVDQIKGKAVLRLFPFNKITRF